MRSVSEAHIGDTLFLKDQKVEPLPGFKLPKPMVYAGIYPMDQSQYHDLSTAISKLVLNDSAVSVAKESRLKMKFLNNSKWFDVFLVLCCFAIILFCNFTVLHLAMAGV